jgi:hypothetical protein
MKKTFFKNNLKIILQEDFTRISLHLFLFQTVQDNSGYVNIG